MTVFALAIVMAGSSLALSATSARAQEPGAEEPPAEDFPLELGLVEQSTWVAAGDDFTMTLDVAGNAGALPADSTLGAHVYSKLTTRDQFNDTLASLEGRSQHSTPVTTPVAEIERTGNGQLVIAFNTTEAGLSEEGVYPVEVDLTAADGEVLGRIVTYLLLQPQAEYAPLDVAVVVEMGAAPAQQPNGSIDLPSEELAQLTDRTELLEATEGLSAAPVPETLNSLALASDVAAASALVSDLEPALGKHDVLGRPYVDLDLEAWAAAGLVGEAPAEFDRGAAALRNRFNAEPTPNIWLPDATIGQAEATTWRDLGAVNAILPTDENIDVEGEPDSIFPLIQLPEGPHGFISDGVLVDRLTNVEDPIDQQRFIAELAMIWFEQPGAGRAVVLRLPADGPLNPEKVAETLNDLGPSLSLITATDLFAEHGPTDTQPATPVTLHPKEESEDLRWVPPRLVKARQTIDSLGPILDDQELASLQRALLIAPGARTDNRRAYFERIDDEAQGIADAINAPEEFQITLTDRTGVIPLTISNDLTEEVAVRVELSSNQLEFQDGDEMKVTVPPGGDRFDIRVRTRTSGAFPLHVTLTSADGAVRFDETTFDIRSTAISGVGLVLSIGAGLFLVIWWARHWLRSRKTRTVSPYT